MRFANLLQWSLGLKLKSDRPPNVPELTLLDNDLRRPVSESLDFIRIAIASSTSRSATLI